MLQKCVDSLRMDRLAVGNKRMLGCHRWQMTAVHAAEIHDVVLCCPHRERVAEVPARSGGAEPSFAPLHSPGGHCIPDRVEGELNLDLLLKLKLPETSWRHNRVFQCLFLFFSFFLFFLCVCLLVSLGIVIAPEIQVRSRKKHDDVEQNNEDGGLFTGTQETARQLDGEIAEKYAVSSYTGFCIL